MTKGKHGVSRALRHPVGPERASVYWRRRSLTLIGVLSVLGLVGLSVFTLVRLVVPVQDVGAQSEVDRTPTGQGVSESPTSSTAQGLESDSPTPVEIEAEREPGLSFPATDPSRSSTDQTTQPSETPDASPVGSWNGYPWGSNGLECPHPSTSSGADSSNTGVRVVILGDSLVRNARSAIDAALANYGIRPVFVCWGGKTLGWGGEQVQIMRDLGVTPDCLVINLGTNDLKGTTANGLADAVPLSTVEQRLTGLLLSVSDIPHVFAVDIAADLNVAPGTMSEVSQAPQIWVSAVSQAGVGEVVPWASGTQSNPSLIGGDGIHDSDAGVIRRASLIAQSVARYCA